MNELVHGMVKGYLDTFDTYDIKGESLKCQVEDYRASLLNFAGQIDDVSEFYKKFAESGLQEEYMSLIGKVAMADMGSADEEGNVRLDYSDKASPKEMTVKEFVDQYRIPYEEIRKSGYRKRGEIAYEKIFAIADKTEDMLEAQIMIEEEELLWKIVTEDFLDISATTYEAMDPLNAATVITLKKQIEAYKKAQSHEELTYLIEVAQPEIMRTINDYSNKINVASILTELLMEYVKAKEEIYKWRKNSLKKSLKNMILLRDSIKQLLDFMEANMEMSFQDLLRDEGMKIWMLLPSNADAMGRIKTALNPQNYKAYNDIVENEILADISICDILKRKPDFVVWFDLNRIQKNDYDKRAEMKAKELNKDLDYYKYQKQGG